MATKKAVDKNEGRRDGEQLKDGVKVFYAPTREAWRKWLQTNHEKEKSVWLNIYKKESGTPSIYYPEAVDEALCFGWIDSKANKKDDDSYYQSFAKRNPKSNWSRINKEKIEKLSAEGRMAEAGLKMVEIAKENGTWNALDDVENLVVPTDMQVLLDKNKAALKNWESFPKSVKRGILEWILNAKKPETRQKRIEETVSMAAENKRANQYRQP
ncbi:YdeI/OmpD-associated family protein [Flavobacterium sp.]|uniref:YdeI/OmpD-associated family protein n=1 Tax=Flavobacterium sp. TaxID=239 RepID=UPI00260D5FD8|nr:YdeI/OmpD-associated family protein [Flavobacterium sp.]